MNEDTLKELERTVRDADAVWNNAVQASIYWEVLVSLGVLCLAIPVVSFLWHAPVEASIFEYFAFIVVAIIFLIVGVKRRLKVPAADQAIKRCKESRDAVSRAELEFTYDNDPN